MEKQKVLEHFGGLTATAKALGISAQAVFQWPDVIPVGRAYQIQCLTKGKLKAESKGRAA